MDIIQTIILGLVQGLTEWLPVSSSGHLVVVQRLMNLSVPVAFDVMLHMGTLAAVMFFFWKDIVKILRSLLHPDMKNHDFRFALYVIVGSIPTLVIGLLFLDFFESLFSNISAVAIGFIITGALLLLSKFFKQKRKLGWFDSILIGTAQAVSIAPGISRSGATITTGLMRGVKRLEVFKYSFLLSIPAVIGANMIELNWGVVSEIGTYSMIGMIVSAVSGYFAIKFVQKSILSEKFHLFGIYCLALGLIVLTLL